MRKWGNNKQFNDYYDLVLENSTRKAYRVNDQKVLALAAEQHLDVSQIPSINRSMAWWDPTDIYGKIQNTSRVGKVSASKNYNLGAPALRLFDAVKKN
jgi:hypothetical protein